MTQQRPLWEELEDALARTERHGLAAMDLADAKRFAQLYRLVSADLIRARTEQVELMVIDYLNDLIARAYGRIYGTTRRPNRRLWRFFAHDFPRLFRSEWRAVALAAALLLGGGLLGAWLVAADADALGVLLPEQHQAWTPAERIERDTSRGAHSGVRAARFSSFLFTHNIKVGFLVFALGITFGLGTVFVLFFNGVPLGALAMQYHDAGQDLFFWAWILPHGIPELTSIFIAGAAGLLLARALIAPGRESRRDALVREGRRAAHLIVGTMPILVVAGLIEGTISQIHAPTIPYAAKLAFAAIVGAGLYSWLLLAGRSPGGVEVTPTESWSTNGRDAAPPHRSITTPALGGSRGATPSPRRPRA